MWSSLYVLSLLATTIAAPTTELSRRAGSGKLQFVGSNESGAEFGNTNIPGVYGKDYIFPDVNTVSTLIANGLNIFRVQFLMERLTPGSLAGAFDAAYLNNLTHVVNSITQKGAHVLIDPHNFARFNGHVITDTAAFGAWWNRVATLFKGNGNVIFDVNNEPHDMPGALVASLNQAAINGIRAAGATSQFIAVEGNSYTGAWTWTTNPGTDGKTNAQTMGSLTDPSGKILYEMHQYLDTDGSGTSAVCVSSTVGSARLVAATEWLRANGKKGLLGEFAGGVNDVCKAAIVDMLDYLGANSDVWEGALWWAAGPFWGNYIYSIEPGKGLAYSTYVPLLAAKKQ